jgi:hypothetical protein
LRISKRCVVRRPTSSPRLTRAVWSPHLHPLPRLPTTRHPPRRSPLLHNPLPPLRCLRRRARSSPTSAGLPPRRQKAQRCCNTWRELCPLLGRASKVPKHLETNSLDPRRECNPLPPHNLPHSLLLHPPPPNRHPLRSARRHRLAQDRILRFHQPRSQTCLPAPFEAGRRRLAGHIQPVSLPTEYHARESDVLLVGPNPSLPTGLPAHPFYPLVVRFETTLRSLHSQRLHVYRLSTICHTPPAQFPPHARLPKHFLYSRTANEVVYNQPSDLASGFLCAVPELLECACRGDALWG